MPALGGCRIAMSGSVRGYSQKAIMADLVSLGADTSASVDSNTTHLITSQADFDKQSTKVKAAKDLGIPIVNDEWLRECQRTDSKVSENAFLFCPVPSAAPTNSTSTSAVAAPAAVASVPIPASNGTRKRPAPRNASAPADASAPAAKKIKTPSSTEDVPEPVRALGAAQVAKRSDMHVPVDEGFQKPGFAVYIDEDGVIFDAALNQTNASNNNNKFYRIQLVASATKSYHTWTRWGRVGEHGQTALLGDGTLSLALKNFEKKFKDKSGLAWENRADPPRPGKYVFVERSYNTDSEDEAEDEDANASTSTKAKGKKKADDWKPPSCTLRPAVQDLMELIFNQQFFAAAMNNLNYDMNKLPLGKLSKATILRGFQILKDLSALLDDASLAANYDLPHAVAIEHLSNQFYSLIPHAFGRNRPPVIQMQQMVKKEIELLENLSDMKDATLIMKMDQVGDDPVHPLDRQYMGLGMQEMTPLDPVSAEYNHLRDYLVNTCGSTHRANYQVEQIFRIERTGEADRFRTSPFAAVAQSNRRLLWHGSRTTNFGGILSQGLRIAPPEAPVSGYMFDKGIYLADMSSKSANYCCSFLSDNTALLLLCEAELGSPVLELLGACSNAAKEAKAKGMISTWGKGGTGPILWKDASCVHPSLAGVSMPDTSVMPGRGNTGVQDSSLLYNEYICYDVAQVRLRYLFRVKM